VRIIAILSSALLILAGCSKQDRHSPAPPEAPKATQAPQAPLAPIAPKPPPASKTLIEPKGPIDPKSAEAAGQVVQHFGALIEQNRYGEAERLWRDAKAAKDFTSKLKPGTHLEIGDLGESEGAAGSIYVTQPVVFYGEGFRRPAEITLRRVNDVPGSSEAERRWRIERIEWKDGA
jgi:hypothetical protein